MSGLTAEREGARCPRARIVRASARLRAAGTSPSALLILVLMVAQISGCRSDNQDTLERIRTEKVIRVGTDATYPPFETRDIETGKIVGFDVDLIHEIAEKLGARVEFQVVPFDGILAALRSGKFDAVISALTITKERAQAVRFSKPYYAAGQSIAIRSDSEIRGAEDLKGRRIGVQLGTTGEIAAKRVAYAEVISFDAIGAALIDLRNGRLDAVIADTPTTALFTREHTEIRIVGEPITRESYGIAFRIQDADLKKAVDEILDEFEESGRMEELRGRWGLEVP